jgi:hypothetical protein
MQRERDEPTNRSDSPKVPIVSIFDFEEACQGEGNVHGAKRKSAVNTNHHRWSHLNLVNDKERENEDCMPRVSILLGDYKHPPPPGQCAYLLYFQQNAAPNRPGRLSVV